MARLKGSKDKRPRKRATSPVAIADQVSEQRSEVALLATEGLTDVEIAMHLGIDLETLHERFAAELAHPDPMARARNLSRLNKAAGDGNVTAMRTIQEIITRAGAERRFTEAPPDQPDMLRQKQIGKKEQRLADAQTAGQGTDWGSDLETPPAVVH